MCRDHVYVLGQPPRELWHGSPALLSLAQRDVRTLPQCVPCLSTSRHCATWEAGYVPEDGGKPWQGWIWFPQAQCMCIMIMCVAHKLCGYHANARSSWMERNKQMFWLFIFLTLTLKALCLLVQSLFPLQAYIDRNPRGQRHFVPGANCDHLGVAAGNTVLRRALRHMLTQQDEALWLISKVFHRWGWGNQQHRPLQSSAMAQLCPARWVNFTV